MRKGRLWIASVLGFVLSCTTTAIDTATKHHLLEKSQQFFELTRKKRFDEAVLLLHYPPTYTDEQLRKDRGSLAEFLRILSEEFGTVSSTHEVPEVGPIVHLRMETANKAYWEDVAKPTAAADIHFETEFARQGRGFVTLRFAQFSRKWELRSVRYAIPDTGSLARRRVAEIGSVIMRRLQPFL